MENNWKEKAIELINKNWKEYINTDSKFKKLSQEKRDAWIDKMTEYSVNPMVIRSTLEFGNLVFEATKKECADKANLNRELEDSGPGIINVHEIFAYDVFYKNGTVTVNKDSILNIEKPNL